MYRIRTPTSIDIVRLNPEKCDLCRYNLPGVTLIRYRQYQSHCRSSALIAGCKELRSNNMIALTVFNST